MQKYVFILTGRTGPGYSTAMNGVFPKGSKRDILQLIKRRGGITLLDATSALPLSKATLRQHLLQLEEQGLVRREYAAPQGQGRPKVIFELTELAQGLFPSKNSLLLTEMIDHFKSSGQSHAVESFFKKYWAKRRDDFEKLLASLLKSRPKGSEARARREALRTLLEAEGFMPEIHHGKKLQVRECNCPFSGVLPSTTAPCRLESDFISWALKVPMRRTSYIPSGDSSCSYSS